MKITLVGLGVGKDSLSLAAYKAIKNADKVICKTQLTKSALIFKEENIPVEFLDEFFLRSKNFDTLCKKLADYVIKQAKTQNVVYCVDGSVADDNSCAFILKKHKNTDVLDGLSHSVDLLSRGTSRGGYTAMSAYSPEKFTSSAVRPFILYDIDNFFVASDWKLRLTDAFGDQVEAKIYIDGEIKNIRLYMLDSFEHYDYTTVLLIDDCDFLHKERFCLDDLYNIVFALRDENGCPWDKAQTHESIMNNLIEECYEMYDALKQKDTFGIVEESGDILLQIVFHTVFGEEINEYNRNDVVSGICEKLISRHTHVFGNDKADSGDSALTVWEKNKSIEKDYKSASEYLQCVPHSFPALMRAQKLQKRAAKYNFDFSSVQQIYDKLQEEAQEVKDAASKNDANLIFEEVGDLLFTVVNLSRFYGVNAEEALAFSNDKFLNRFTALENAVKKDGKSLENMTEEEIDKYYNEIKKS